MRRFNLLQRPVFQANMTFLYHMMKASESLLLIARQMTMDPFLKTYYDNHLEEERGHAQWLQRDLIEGGFDFAAIPREAILMAGVQYYLLFHVSPASLLGYMAVLELTPMPMEQIAALEAAYGVAALRTLRYHAEHDVDHGRDLLSFIESRPTHEQAAIMESASQACYFMNAAMPDMEISNG